MAGFTTDLLVGVAEHLDAAAVASWEPAAAYDQNTAGIFIATLPEHTGGVVTLTAYGMDDDPILPDSTMGLQVRVRAPGRDPRDSDDLADAAYDALQGLGPVDLNGVHIQLCTRVSSLPMGMDATGRWERSDNYRVQVHRPGTHRL